MRITERLISLISESLRAASFAERIPADAARDVTIERPQNSGNGDFSTSIALKLARALRMPPLEIAEEIVRNIPPALETARVWAARPGFVNFVLSPEWLAAQLDDIRAEGPHFGHSQQAKPQKIQVEFVSVNPTGPVHVGHARGAVFGSTLANVLTAVGHEVRAFRTNVVQLSRWKLLAFGRPDPDS